MPASWGPGELAFQRPTCYEMARENTMPPLNFTNNYYHKVIENETWSSKFDPKARDHEIYLMSFSPFKMPWLYFLKTEFAFGRNVLNLWTPMIKSYCMDLWGLAVWSCSDSDVKGPSLSGDWDKASGCSPTNLPWTGAKIYDPIQVAQLSLVSNSRTGPVMFIYNIVKSSRLKKKKNIVREKVKRQKLYYVWQLNNLKVRF